MLFAVENFYLSGGHQHHELGVYFSASFSPSSRMNTLDGPIVGSEGNQRLVVDWFDRRCLSTADIRRSLPVEALARPVLEFRHVVHPDSTAPMPMTGNPGQ